MEWLNFGIAAALFAQTGGPPQAPTPMPPPAPVKATAPAAAAPARTTTTTTGAPVVVSESRWRKAGCNTCAPACNTSCDCCDPFDDFIGPISAPYYAKDPRALTELRALYIHNWIPDAAGGGDFDLFGAQLRVALNERVTFILDKAGYVTLDSDNRNVRDRDGWLNLSTGLNYTFLRDCEKRAVGAAGVMYEIPTGSNDINQGFGSGVVTPFLSYARAFGCSNHFIGNVSYSFGLDDDASSFVFTQLHFDRQINDWLYPLVELNWIHYTDGGNNLPAGIEGDTIANFGAQGVAGNDLFTVAVGAKAKVRRNLEAGLAWEMPLSNNEHLIDHRFISELILRY